MTRRNAQLPWGAGGNRGLYDGRKRRNYGSLAGLALIVICVVALGYFLFTKMWGAAECKEPYCSSGQEIAPPPGYEFATKIYEYNEKQKIAPGNDILVGLPLSTATTDARNLSFYRYVPETKAWELVAAALLDGGRANATLHDTPKVIAVLRRNTPGGSVIAYLPHNGELHPEAVGKITVLHTLDFAPSADAGVSGELSTVKQDDSFQHIPVISARSEVKGSVQTVQTVLANDSARSQHVQNIAKKVAETGVAGIDVSYLDLTANERTSFSLFVTELGQVLHHQNKQLTLTLPPPLKAPDRIDEGAYDWAALGQAADILQITPYRDQGKFRTDMPEILQYLAAKVQPSTKLVLTVTPYATEKGDGIRTMTITEAMDIATKLSIRTGSEQKLSTNSVVDIVGVNVNKNDGRSGVLWDPNTATVAFTYEQGGGRTVWLENFFSVGFKLEFISRFKLGGVAVEDASKNVLLGNIWTALVPFIASGQPVLMQPNPQDLQPVWQVSKGNFEDTRKGSVKWSTPAEANTYTIKLTLSDGVSRFQSEISANVQERDKKTPTASATPTG